MPSVRYELWFGHISYFLVALNAKRGTRESPEDTTSFCNAGEKGAWDPTGDLRPQQHSDGLGQGGRQQGEPGPPGLQSLRPCCHTGN